MTGASFDSRELASFARELDVSHARMAPKIKAAVDKAAVNIKETLREDARGSRSFRELARFITYDVTEDDQGYSAEIGPKNRRSGGGRGAIDFGANIAYFGNSRGAGGTLRDPVEALNKEAPALDKYLTEAVSEVLDG